MKDKKLYLFPVLFLFICSFIFSAPLYSPTWGFKVDLPEDYEYSGGDKRERFSFETPDGAKFDLIVYATGAYASVEALAQDVQRRLNNKGDMDSFEYRGKKAWLLELSFSVSGSGGRASPMAGWAICAELGIPEQAKNASGAARAPNQARPLLVAMAYGPAENEGFQPMHFSALDSIALEDGDRFAPGPITEYSYPRETRVKTPVFGLGIEAWIYEEDAEAAQAFIDREFNVLNRYANGENWQDAWIRFYRAIYRDSFERLADTAFQVERKLNVPARENRDFADQALQWVQSFTYERDMMGSDFINLVTAAVEGRGDCDNRAMLWALVLNQANIPSAIMVSRYYSHAMGLADLPGSGARFEVEGEKLLVAETTSRVSIGLIGETVSDIEHWLGILFE